MFKSSQKAADITEDDMMGEVDMPDAERSDKQDNINTQQSNEKLINYPERSELEAQLTALEEKSLKEKMLLEEKLLRTLAEMENMRKRGEQRVTEAHKYGIAKLLEELLPILDSLEQSLNVQESDNELVKNMRQGMVLTLQMLLKTLSKFGVKEINPDQGESFNPALHEVMLTQESAEAVPNSILNILQKGYQLHDRLIRPARVMLAKAPLEKT